MPDLRGRRVALLEARLSSDLANLVRRHGGEPYAVPAVREEPRAAAAEVANFLDQLAAGGFTVAVFLTGVGATLLFDTAEHLGRLPELLSALEGLTTVCRGPKPSAALRRRGVHISLGVASPFTTADVLAALAPLDLAGKGVALVHYGERSAVLAEHLQHRGARLTELLLYEWRLPEDLGPLRALVGELLAGRLDAIAFTTQVQARHLFQVAAEMGQADALARALQSGPVVAAVGPTCAAVLEEYGVTPQVVPEQPKMGPMVLALAEYISGRERAK
jgi:uroporphyrinogen-III synthase